MIHPGGQGTHIRAADRAPAQHRRQQCVGTCRLLPQRGDKLGGEQACLEFSGRQPGEEHSLCQLDACRFQNISSL